MVDFQSKLRIVHEMRRRTGWSAGCTVSGWPCWAGVAADQSGMLRDHGAVPEQSPRPAELRGAATMVARDADDMRMCSQLPTGVGISRVLSEAIWVVTLRR